MSYRGIVLWVTFVPSLAMAGSMDISLHPFTSRLASSLELRITRLEARIECAMGLGYLLGFDVVRRPSRISNRFELSINPTGVTSVIEDGTPVAEYTVSLDQAFRFKARQMFAHLDGCAIRLWGAGELTLSNQKIELSPPIYGFSLSGSWASPFKSDATAEFSKALADTVFV